MVVVQYPVVTSTVEIGDLTVEDERLKQKFTNLESEKEMIFEEKYILENANKNNELPVLNLQTEVTDL